MNDERNLVYTTRPGPTIPAFSFPPEWEVQMIPAHIGATVRFRVLVTEELAVSVYLDCHDNLGCVGEPYWEVYDGEDCARCLMAETDTLIELVNAAIETYKGR